MPVAPEGLSGEARAEWDRVIRRLSESNLLTTADDAVLESHCRLHAAATRLEQAVDELPSLFYERIGADAHGREKCEPRVHPGVAQLRQFRQALRGYLAELGLTPLSRGRVRIVDPPFERRACTTRDSWAG